MLTYMRSRSVKSDDSKRSAERSAKERLPSTVKEDDIPPSPPEPLRSEYLHISWSYVRWCMGMLVWSVLCVVYFFMTRQRVNAVIGISLGVLLVAMIVLPAMLFGGTTWFKRLGWMMLLLAMFTAMWIYPIVVIGYGIRKRIAGHRYHHMSTEDIWHTALAALTVIVATWTISATIRCGKLVRRLYKGSFGITEVQIRH